MLLRLPSTSTSKYKYQEYHVSSISNNTTHRRRHQTATTQQKEAFSQITVDSRALCTDNASFTSNKI